ncbi:MAG: choice-of-anchor D domain-containing protein [Actinomycetota bacterium]|nr:choice-of-anchor D domain-containing protein [Actinomycetota bacterium]
MSAVVAIVLVALVAVLLQLTKGTPVAAASAVTVSPGSAQFASQPVGTMSPVTTITIANRDKSLSVPIRSAEIAGPNAAEFVLAASICNNASLPPGQSCTVDIRFTPTTAGKRSASLLVHRADAPQALVVQLAGDGAAQPINVASSVDFGQLGVGATSVAKTIPVTNASAQPVVVTGLATGGDNPNDFSVKAEPIGCVTTLAPGSSCTLTVNFTPTAVGDRNASVAVNYQGLGSPMYVRLRGSAALLGLTAAPVHVDFGSQLVGTASGPMTVTISNPVGPAVAIATVALSGPDAASFTIGADGCSGKTLTARNSCPVSVSFLPQATGARLAMVSITRANEVTTVSPVQLNGFGSPAKTARRVAAVHLIARRSASNSQAGLGAKPVRAPTARPVSPVSPDSPVSPARVAAATGPATSASGLAATIRSNLHSLLGGLERPWSRVPAQ